MRREPRQRDERRERTSRRSPETDRSGAPGPDRPDGDGRPDRSARSARSDRQDVIDPLVEARRERLAQRRRNGVATQAARRPAESGRTQSGMAVCVGAVLVMALVGVGAITLWTRVADARSTTETGPGVDARSLRGSPAGTAAAAGSEGPGHVLVAGDSLTATATYIYGPGEGAPADVQFVAWQGWTAVEAQPALDTAVAEGRADTVVIALATNDSSHAWGGDGWTAADLERFRQLLATPAETACVVLVLPGYGPGIDPHHAAEMDKARIDLTHLADERRQRRATDPAIGPTVVVDWHAAVTARPELLSPDGIHLAQDPASGVVSTEAATARTAIYWDGVAACDD